MPNPRAGTRTQQEQARGNSIAGHATTAGTKRFVQRFRADYAPEFYRGLNDHVSVSSIGMGTYLGDCDDAEDARYVTVLSAGLEQGLNLVDTAINYRCQRSERAVGEAIRKAVSGGSVQRDEVVIATKGGFIPLEGSPPESRVLYERYLTSEYFDKGVMSASDVVGGGHSLSPTFLANQIQRSLSNLGLATIDIYYLHNPEQQRLALDGPRFKSVIAGAFAELESQVSQGTIRCYGCATWHGFRLDPASPGHLNLEELVQVARETGGDDHHFRVVQLPLNLAMTEAVRAPTQTVHGQRMPLLEAAAALGVSVVASASLMQSQLTRGLPAELAVAFPSLTTDAQRALAFARTLPLCAALVGMRTLDHLSENLGAAREIIIT